MPKKAASKKQTAKKTVATSTDKPKKGPQGPVLRQLTATQITKLIGDDTPVGVSNRHLKQILAEAQLKAQLKALEEA